jgi:hypothetical protein
MSNKYYTHFVAGAPGAKQAGEYTGVVEMPLPLHPQEGAQDISTLLASNLNLRSEDIRILIWARLH